MRLARNQPQDAAAVAAGDVDQAVSFFGMAGAIQTAVGRQLAAEGRPANELDGVLQQQAMTMIEETPGRHLLMTLPFAWRGLWAFVNGKYLIVAVCDWVAFVVFLAFPFLALWRRRADWMAFSLFGVGTVLVLRPPHALHPAVL